MMLLFARQLLHLNWGSDDAAHRQLQRPSAVESTF